MKQWNIIGAVVGVLALIFSGLIYFSSTLDRRIEDKFNDPNFINKVAEKVRLPFVVFNDKKSVEIDTGAWKYFEDIKINRNESQWITEIVILPKQYLPVPPILESIDDNDIGFETARRGERFEIIYKTVNLASQWMTQGDPDSKPQRRFRLQMVMLPGN